MQAVVRKFVRRDIIPEVTGLCAFDQQVSDEATELLLCSGDVLTSMHECRKLSAVVLVANERVSSEHSFEPLARVTDLVPDSREKFEVAGDLTLVPGEQDRFDI